MTCRPFLILGKSERVTLAKNYQKADRHIVQVRSSSSSSSFFLLRADSKEDNEVAAAKAADDVDALLVVATVVVLCLTRASCNKRMMMITLTQMSSVQNVKTTQIIRKLFEDRFITSLLMQINKVRHENNPSVDQSINKSN